MSVTFGGLRAVDGVDLEVRPGQLVGLIGPNGAGKTTFIDGITGFVPTGGRIDFDGEDITSTSAHQRARLGLGRTWQSLELFDDLTIRENLQVAAERQSWKDFLLDFVRPTRPRDRTKVDFALDVLDIARPRRPLAERDQPGPAQAGVGRPGARRAAASWCAWTSRRPASTRRSRSNSARGCGGSSTPG